MMKSIVFFVLSIFVINIEGQETPCPNLFRYENNGIVWYGVIRLPTSQFGTSLKLQIVLNIAARLPSSYIGKIEVIGDRSEIAETIARGGIITYKVNFPLPNPIPTIESIVVNGGEYCSGLKQDYPLGSSTYTSLKLNHELSLGPQFVRTTTSRPYYPAPVRTTTQAPPPVFVTRPTTTTPAYVPQPEVPTTNNYYSNSIDDACGAAEVQGTNALITNGMKTTRGEWPWIAAIFVIENGGYNFICSGTLISASHIVTAGHCIDKSKSRAVKLGVKTIDNWHDSNQKTLKVLDEIVHPNFDEEKLFNDIALMKVYSVTFNKFIKPACLISNRYNLVGRKGTVVGWGKDENGKISPELRKAFATVVSNAECARGDFRFSSYINDNTICAGERDGSGPCNGDSGGGLFIFNNGRWYIKGIVSNSLPDIETAALCTNKDYVIYTYIDQFTSWIESTKQIL